MKVVSRQIIYYVILLNKGNMPSFRICSAMTLYKHALTLTLNPDSFFWLTHLFEVVITYNQWVSEGFGTFFFFIHTVSKGTVRASVGKPDRMRRPKSAVFPLVYFCFPLIHLTAAENSLSSPFLQHRTKTNATSLMISETKTCS